MKYQAILFVDGYNMIGAWPELVRHRQDDIQLSRDLLLESLSNYAKYRDLAIIVVFDAQLVPGIKTSFRQYNLQVVFTAEGETADAYIEREVGQYVGPLNRVTVATSDMAEQWMIFQQGAMRQSANELWLDLQYAKREIQKDVQQFYEAKIRRHSPWRGEQLARLDALRRTLNDE